MGGVAITHLGACGGETAGKGEPKSAVEQRDEGKAERLLERARESGQPDDFKKILNRFPSTEAAKAAGEELAEIQVRQAEIAFKADDLETAENLALEAKVHANLATTEKAQKLVEQIDEKRIELLSKESAGLADAGRCASALKVIAEPLGKKPRERFKKGLQDATRQSLVDCLKKRMQKELDVGNVEAARMLIETDVATAALDKQGYDDAHLLLEKAIVAKSTTTIQPFLEKRQWQKAIDELDKLRSENKLDKREYDVAFAIVQDAIHKSLLLQAKDALVAKNPGAMYQGIEEQQKLARWKRVPADLEKVYGLLRIAIECEAQKCRLQNAKAAWSWGAIDIHPPDSAGDDPKSKTKHAQQVFVVGKSRKLSLISLENTGSARGEELLSKVAGWIDHERLKSKDTILWLPPVEQLEGVRVWGPLRAPEPDFMLGIVEKVDGKEVVVKRLADDQKVTVKLKELRVGTLQQGLKVKAFCEDQLHVKPAKIDKIVTRAGGTIKVKVLCEKSDKEPVVLANSLLSEERWLPTRRPRAR